MKQRERRARTHATNLLDSVGITEYPVEPAAIAAHKGLRLLERPLGPGVYGALAKAGGEFLILVSPDCPTSGHRRFTIAHELGHFHLPGHVEEMFAGGGDAVVPSVAGHFRGGATEIERESDWFASELLAPGGWATPHVEALDPCVGSLKALAAEFDTSLTMMALRYCELSDEPVAAVLSKGGIVEWTVGSERLREHRWSWSLRPGDPLPAGTVSAALGKDRKAVGRMEERSGMGPLCSWFERGPEDFGVEEDALGLGASGRLLSFLVVPDLPEPAELEGEPADDPATWKDALRGF